MTFKQIETEFDEKFPTLRYGHNVVFGENYGTLVKSFFKQSFIKYLKDECERLKEKLPNKEDLYDPEIAGRYDEISDQITHITNQIRELEK